METDGWYGQHMSNLKDNLSKVKLMAKVDIFIITIKIFFKDVGFQDYQNVIKKCRLKY